MRRKGVKGRGDGANRHEIKIERMTAGVQPSEIRAQKQEKIERDLETDWLANKRYID